MTKQTLFFRGTDSSLNNGLWDSDGSSAGTVEVGGLQSGGITGAGANLSPNAIGVFGTRVLFMGIDSSGGFGLWASNGTAAGTYEIGGLKDGGVTGANSTGLNASGFVSFGGKALFYGYDSSNYDGLWVTDGTTAGTIELGGLHNSSIPGEASTGLNAYYFTPFADRLLFTGKDSANYQGLWITDGTTAGTTEIGGLKNAAIAGVNGAASGSAALNFIALGKTALFDWVDAGQNSTLWVTDGTAAGTTEIGGSKNAGVAGASALGTDAPALFGQKALLRGFDTSGYANLWVTDGTAGGTSEIGGLGGAALNGGANFALNPHYITSISTASGDKAVFQGLDPLGYNTLWVTDGTTNGTFEIGGPKNAGIPNAYTGTSAAIGFTPSSFVSIGSKALFEGFDTGGNQTLWVTDGTAAGTFEIGGLHNGGVANTPSYGLTTSDFVAAGDVAFFHATDSSNNYGLWVSDGTLAGTHEIVNVPNSAGGGWAAAEGVSPAKPAFGDVNGDGTSDLLWKNQSTGDLYEWSMSNGQAAVSNIYLGQVSGWNEVATGDFFGAGTSDLVWQSQSTGAVYEWTMSNGQHTGTSDYYLGNLSGWNEIGVGDFYGAGTDDLLWQNQTTGDVYEWQMSSGQHTGNDVYLGNLSGWSVVGTGDYTGNGVADIIWQNQSSGATYEWTMTAGQHTGNISLGNLAGWSGK
jgi:ELWxxDGT repeat protein